MKHARPLSTLPAALVAAGRRLGALRYSFVTVTPATHERVLARAPGREADNLRDVFGWSRAFAPGLLPPGMLDEMVGADLVASDGRLLRSRVRFSSLQDRLFAHSAHPTAQADAVFFGPDTYRFVGLIDAELAHRPLDAGARILDVGCGSGAGGIAAASMATDANAAAVQAAGGASPSTDTPLELVLCDINPRALQFAQANAELAGMATMAAPAGRTQMEQMEQMEQVKQATRVTLVQSDLFASVAGQFDLIVANPPYLVDPAERAYRHGGGAYGGGLSERIVAEGLPRLAPGGRLVLYTGAAMVAGADPLLGAMQPVLRAAGWRFNYRELDPDVFGEELDAAAYADAERIAAVALTVERPAR